MLGETHEYHYRYDEAQRLVEVQRDGQQVQTHSFRDASTNELDIQIVEVIKKIFSSCGNQKINIVRDGDGTYFLRKFVRKYDAEEDKYYEIRELPDPAGRFGDLDSAAKQAINLLGTAPHKMSKHGP